MPSTFFFLAGTLLLAFNLIRPFGVAISDWFYFLALIFAVLETFTIDNSNRSCWFNNRFLGPAWLILLGSILSLYHSKFIPIAIVEIVQQLYVITFFVSMISIMIHRKKMEAIVIAFIGSGLIAASIAMFDYFTGAEIGPILSGTIDMQLWGRYAGPLGHPNKLGYFLAITSTLSLSRLMASLSNEVKRRLRLVWAVIYIVQLFGLYLTGSMTAYLGVLLSNIILIFSSKIFARKTMIFAYLVLLFGASILYLRGVLGVTYELNSSAIQEISAATIERVRTKTAEARLLIYDEAISYIFRNPIIGAGMDQNSTSGIELTRRELSGSIHNIFLQVWYTGGIVSLIGWSIVLFYAGWNALRYLFFSTSEITSYLALGLAAAVVGILLMDQFQDGIYQREQWLAINLFVATVWNRQPMMKGSFTRGSEQFIEKK